jgi:beta-galactosidase
VHNFGFQPHTVTPPVPVADVLTGAPAERLELGPWDVRILCETTR